MKKFAVLILIAGCSSPASRTVPKVTKFIDCPSGLSALMEGNKDNCILYLSDASKDGPKLSPMEIVFHLKNLEKPGSGPAVTRTANVLRVHIEKAGGSSYRVKIWPENGREPFGLEFDSAYTPVVAPASEPAARPTGKPGPGGPTINIAIPDGGFEVLMVKPDGTISQLAATGIWERWAKKYPEIARLIPGQELANGPTGRPGPDQILPPIPRAPGLPPIPPAPGLPK